MRLKFRWRTCEGSDRYFQVKMRIVRKIQTLSPVGERNGKRRRLIIVIYSRNRNIEFPLSELSQIDERRKTQEFRLF